MVSRTVEYALRAVVCLGRHAPAALSATRVAGETRVPATYLSKVLQSLVRAGLVRATRGSRGGYALAVPSKGLTVLQVVNAIEPLKRITTCPLGLPGHANGALCPLHRNLDAAVERAEASFGRTTVAKLIDEGGDVGALCEA